MGKKDSKGFERPHAEKACSNTEACETRWQCSPWSVCQSGCGTSKQTRTCNCWRSDGTNSVDGQNCKAKGLVKPSELKTCTSFEHCNYMWHIGGQNAAAPQ